MTVSDNRKSTLQVSKCGAICQDFEAMADKRGTFAKAWPANRSEGFGVTGPGPAGQPSLANPQEFGSATRATSEPLNSQLGHSQMFGFPTGATHGRLDSQRSHTRVFGSILQVTNVASPGFTKVRSEQAVSRRR